MSREEWVDYMYNPFDMTLGCSSCEPSDDSSEIFDYFDSAFGNPTRQSSNHAHFSNTSRGYPSGLTDMNSAGVQVNQGAGTPFSSSSTNYVHNSKAHQQNVGLGKTQLSPDDVTHSAVVSLGSLSGSYDDAEDTYRAGLKGDHGGLTRPAFTPVMSLQQAKALAAEKEVGTSAAQPAKRSTMHNQYSSYSLSGKSTSDIVLENLKQHSPPRKITTVTAMSAQQAAEKFKSKYGDPAAEKKKMKEMAFAASKQVDPKQHPDWPKRNSDPIKSALAKPPSVIINKRVSTNERQPTKSRVKPKIITLHSFV